MILIWTTVSFSSSPVRVQNIHKIHLYGLKSKINYPQVWFDIYGKHVVLKLSDSKLKQWSAKVEWEFISSPKGEVGYGFGHLKNRIKQPCLGIFRASVKKADSLSYAIKGHIVWSKAFPMDSSRNIVKARPLGQPLIKLVVGVVHFNLLWFERGTLWILCVFS